MKKRKVRKPFRYCDDDDDSFEVPQPPENFPATMKTTESAADIPGQGDDTNESTRNTEAVNQQSPLKPSNLVSLEDTKLQQKPPVSKLLSPAEFQQEVLRCLAALRIVQQQQGELLVGLTSRLSKQKFVIEDVRTKAPFGDFCACKHLMLPSKEHLRMLLLFYQNIPC
ncbi:uncharacterized protein LOC119462456 isoform X1 [Dermacentor silvarum]|uniref:uncharacterized protein LOC119462456 isoform X1 n=1 Tax=Dermacentor silvarum TaxID=543639 RepID=UPI00210150CE|nr:uncharacterized protein LOC119462456 isoform X1 [Dermacentor silvarum]XP_049529075.1 uncharacterized protein LOC119462456 isoform X1 [Dermacentor silvarum]